MYRFIKKFSAIFLAFIFALFVTEILIGNILGFPKYGVYGKMTGMRSSKGHQNDYKPYSEYWNAKGKFEIYKRNNLGLPGIDVDTSINAKYICVLGSSFIENNYMRPEAIATSVFQNLLKKINKDYSVLNLGYNGYDPYDCYRRLAYYERKYKPECVILVINDYKSDSYKLIDNPFKIDSNDFSYDNSIWTKAGIELRNNMAFARLALTLFQSVGEEQDRKAEAPGFSVNADSADLNDLFICLKEFEKKYDDKFICASIINNDAINARISRYCKDENINYYYSNIMTAENQLNGNWHLNEKGNRELGKFLHDIFCEKYNIIK